MSYATSADLIDRFGEAAFLQLADRDRDGQADLDVVARALTDAGGEIDGWLSRRYPVPVTPAPPRLVTLAADIAWYRLHGDSLAEQSAVRMAYRDALAYLRQVADGAVDLPGVAAAGTTAAPSPAVVVAGPGRAFSRTSLRGL